jgi:hypothetical protein
VSYFRRGYQFFTRYFELASLRLAVEALSLRLPRRPGWFSLPGEFSDTIDEFT